MTHTPEPYYAADGVTLYLDEDQGCLGVLPTLPDASVDAIVCDPPYELGFMGKAWDSSGIAYNVDVWRECWRVLKPGGHLLAFGGTRTYHRMTVAIEDAGFEIRDSLHWIYGSGFVKSLNVAKAIESGGGRPEDIRRMAMGDNYQPSGRGRVNYDHGGGSVMNGKAAPWRPTTEDGKRWEGFGTALKPAHEPIVLARKALAGTVAAAALQHGTGALNIDACRTAAGQDYREKCASVVGIASPRNGDTLGEWTGARDDSAHPAGRWPTNILLGHSPDCDDECAPGCPVPELGAEARFFPVFRYEAKAPASERPRLPDGTAHPTVKPLALMRWLVRLVTPPGGTVLDWCAGSGPTLEAAVLEGFTGIGIELERPHAELCRVRLSKPLAPALFGEAS